MKLLNPVMDAMEISRSVFGDIVSTKSSKTR